MEEPPTEILTRPSGSFYDQDYYENGTPYVFDPRTRSLRKLGPDGNILKRVRMSKKERRALKKAIQDHQA